MCLTVGKLKNGLDLYTSVFFGVPLENITSFDALQQQQQQRKESHA